MYLYLIFKNNRQKNLSYEDFISRPNQIDAVSTSCPEGDNSTEAKVPDLRYLDHIAAMKTTSKRPSTVLSPLSEDESVTKLLNLISSAVKKSNQQGSSYYSSASDS